MGHQINHAENPNTSKTEALKRMKEKKAKIDSFCWTLVLTCIMTLALCDLWEWLEIRLYGAMENRVVDNIIMVPIILSLWFNARYFIKTIKNRNA